MPRQPKPVPTERGAGFITISAPMHDLIESRGWNVADVLDDIRTGRFDIARRGTKFDMTADAVRKMTESYERDIPGGLPEMKGDVSWRRATRTWSLDVNHAILDERLEWHEQIPKGTGDAQLTVRGVMLPETVRSQIDERPLRDVVRHPLLDPHDITILTVAVYAPTDGRYGAPSPGSTQFKLRVPRITLPD